MAKKNESELDRMADFLDRLTRDTTARGTVTVLAVNDLAPRGRYQTCRIEGRIVAKGFGPEDVDLEYTVQRDYWPAVGAVLPADVHVDRPERTEILWDRLPKPPKRAR